MLAGILHALGVLAGLPILVEILASGSDTLVKHPLHYLESIERHVFQGICHPFHFLAAVLIVIILRL